MDKSLIIKSTRLNAAISKIDETSQEVNVALYLMGYPNVWRIRSKYSEIPEECRKNGMELFYVVDEFENGELRGRYETPQVNLEKLSRFLEEQTQKS